MDIADLRAILAQMRRLLEKGGDATANRPIATRRLQLVRLQYRTIPLPGRRARSPARHTHRSHVADALRGPAGR